MPLAVATRASPIAGAITPKDALEALPNPLNVSRIETTVPNSPINGDVDAMIDNHDNPIVASFSANPEHTFKSFGFIVEPEEHCLKIESLRTFFAPINIEFRDAFSRLDQLDNEKLLDISIVTDMIK